MTVALDGFGAEQGFDVLAEGARLAAADGIGVRVFGPPSELGLDGVEGIEVVPTAEWIGNDEDPVAAVRAKKEASVVRAAARRRRGRAPTRWSAPARPGRRWPPRPSACAASRACSGPALAVQLPVPGKPVLFLDVGANVEVRAQHLVQFAFLGAAFSAAVLGVERPAGRPAHGRRGGGQGARGGRRRRTRCSPARRGSTSPATSRAATCPPATADVVVTDGFTGNVALKLMEGTAKTVAGAIRDAARSNPLAAARRPAAEARRSAACAASCTPTRPAARSCSACAGSPSSATAAPAPRGSPTRSASPPAASRSTRSAAPRRCCARAAPAAARSPTATRDGA